MIFSGCEVRDWENPYDSDNFIGVQSPVNLTVTQLDAERILLQWDARESQIAGYKIDKKIEDGDWVIEFGRTDTTHWIDTLAHAQNANYYRVYAYAGDNESLPLVTSINPSFPGPTDFQVVQLTDTTLSMSWVDQSKGEDGYRIDRKSGSDDWVRNYKTLPANTTEWTEKEFTLDTLYTYRVYAYTDVNTSGAQEQEIQPVFPAPGDFSLAALDDHRLQLFWYDKYEYEAGYRIYRKSGAAPFTQLTSVSANSETFIDTNLTFGEYYSYKIEAFTAKNNSHPAISQPTTTYMPSPENLHLADTRTDGAHLVWDRLHEDFISGYQVERSVSGGQYEVVATRQDTHYLDTAIQRGNSYRYRVRAMTSHNSGSANNGITVEWTEYYQSDLTGHHNHNVLAVGLDIPNNRIVSGGQDNQVKVWDLPARGLLWSGNHAGPVNLLTLTDDGQSLITGGYDRMVKMWDVSNGTELWVGQHGGVVWSVAFAPGNSRVISTSQDNTIRVWNSADGSEIWKGNHSSEVKKAVTSPGGNTVYSADNNGQVKSWDLQTGQQNWSITLDAAVNTLALSDDGTRLAAATERGMAILNSTAGIVQWDHASSGIEYVAFTSDGATVLSAGAEDWIRLWDVDTGAQAWQVDTTGTLTAFTYAGDAEKVIAGTASGDIIVWKLNQQAPVWSGNAHAEKVQVLDVSVDGNWIISGSYDDTVQAWRQYFGWVGS